MTVVAKTRGRERVEVAVIGGGPAGLSVSHWLTLQGRDHVVLERGRIGESWRSERWDSFCLVTPNRTVQLPGYPYHGADPDGFMPRDDIVAYLEHYAASFDPPLLTGCAVKSLETADGQGYLVQTDDTTIAARSVVVATGALQRPTLPALSADLPPGILELHSSRYRNPWALPPGAVLVVGTGQSGCQIAEELHRAGRRVYLSVGGSGRVFRRYRGKDLTEWGRIIGLDDPRIDAFLSQSSPHLSGTNGGHEINLRAMARGGVRLLGRLDGMAGTTMWFAPDVEQNLARADAHAASLKQSIDQYVWEQALDVPPDDASSDADLANAWAVEAVPELDLRIAGITVVIWGTGFGPDFGWVKVPVFDQDGYPVHRRGITGYPGLSFVGLNPRHKQRTPLLAQLSADTARVTAAIAD